jgi:hypothetical protein
MIGPPRLADDRRPARTYSTFCERTLGAPRNLVGPFQTFGDCHAAACLRDFSNMASRHTDRLVREALSRIPVRRHDSRCSVRFAAASLVVFVLMTVGSGCGSSKQHAKQRAARHPHLSRPLACLKGAGLIDVERRAKNLWRADNEDPFFAVFIDRFVLQQVGLSPSRRVSITGWRRQTNLR